MNTLYKVTNKLNNKVYIGITSKTLEYRKSRHYIDARQGKNYHFYSALLKYNKTDFIWEELLCSKDRKEILKQEQYFIKLYKSNNKEFGYNSTAGGEGVFGIVPWNKGQKILPHVEKALRLGYSKIKAPWTGKKRDKNTMNKLQEGKKKFIEVNGHPLAKSVIAINLESGIGLEFKSISEASKQLNITEKRIYRNLKGSNNIMTYKFILQNS